MDRVFVIAAAVVKDAIRRKVVWIVVIFAALLTFVAPSLPSYGVGVASSVYREISIALMFAASLVLVLALAATRVPSETERRTVFNILARDVRRWHYVTGTWVGLVAVVGVAIVCFTLIAVGAGWLVYREVMWRLFEAALAIWFETGVVAAFTVMMSSVFSPVTSVVGATAFLFIGHAAPGMLVSGHDHSAPWYLLLLETFNVINPVSHGSGYSLGYAAAMSGAFVAASGLLLLAASALFGKRDL